MAEEITGSRYQPGRGPVGGEREKSDSRGPVGGERELRDRLLRGARGVSVTAGGLAVAREITWSRYEPSSATLLHRLSLRIPRATLEILRAYGEDLFRAIFGLELDCGRRGKSLGGGIRRLEALLKARKRKTGRARRCCTDSFYGFRKRR